MPQTSQNLLRSTLLYLIAFCFHAESLDKRHEFTIPLAKIRIGTDSITGKYIRAKIFYSGEKEHSVITGGNDILVKTTNKGTEKTLFREEPSRSFLLSEFEAQEMGKVCKGFIQTLEIFEHDLKDDKYERIRYLDGFFPKFLKGFKILLLLVKNNDNSRQINILLPDTAFDVSLSSFKTDSRILTWQSKKDYIMKLRIVAKELAYQLKMWASQELSSKRHVDIIKNAEVEQIFDLFIKVYFNYPADTKKIEELRRK